MKIKYSDLNIIDIMCSSRDNTECLAKKTWKQYEAYYRDFYCLLACSSKMRNLKQNKEDTIFI